MSIEDCPYKSLIQQEESNLQSEASEFSMAELFTEISDNGQRIIEQERQQEASIRSGIQTMVEKPEAEEQPTEEILENEGHQNTFSSLFTKPKEQAKDDFAIASMVEAEARKTLFYESESEDKTVEDESNDKPRTPMLIETAIDNVFINTIFEKDSAKNTVVSVKKTKSEIKIEEIDPLSPTVTEKIEPIATRTQDSINETSLPIPISTAVKSRREDKPSKGTEVNASIVSRNEVAVIEGAVTDKAQDELINPIESFLESEINTAAKDESISSKEIAEVFDNIIEILHIDKNPRVSLDHGNILVEVDDRENTFGELVLKETLPEDITSVEGIRERADEQDLSESLIQIALLIENEPLENEPILDLFAQLSHEMFVENDDETKQTVTVSPKAIGIMLQIIEELGYENPSDTLIDYIETNGIESLVQSLVYISRLAKLDNRHESNVSKKSKVMMTNIIKPVAEKVGSLVISLTATLETTKILVAETEQ